MRIVSLGAALLLALAACGGAPTPGNGNAAAGKPGAADAGDTSNEKVVNIYNWSDYIDPGVLKDFEAQTGIKVNYDVFDSNEVLETKLLAGNTGYDLVVPTANFLERQVKAGVFQKLDKSRLPNLKNVDPDILRRIALHDPGNEHGVNYLWGTSGLGYNVAKIRERMPNAPVDSWRMLYDPAIVSKFKDCGVSVFDAPSEVVSTVLIYLGKNANSLSPDDLAAAEKVLLSIRPYLNATSRTWRMARLALRSAGAGMCCRPATGRAMRARASRSNTVCRAKAGSSFLTCSQFLPTRRTRRMPLR